MNTLRSALVVVPFSLGTATVAQSTLNFEPSAAETILDTGFTQVAPLGAEPINVAGGIFLFNNVNIPVGRTVRGVGPNPMIWIVFGNFNVDGTLSVDGEDGDRVDTLNSANFPTPGGVSICTSGAGGRGSPNSTDRSFTGEAGFGAFDFPGRGGGGGRLGCQGPAGGSGGGGGVFATAGDPWYPFGGVPFLQQFGLGGSGVNGTLPGGAPGTSVFLDGRPENDFIGVGYDVHRNLVIPGELLQFRGGQGGAGGGDRSPSCTTGDPAFFADAKGGGGGSGGGALIIYALGKIRVGPLGVISANGGNGGGGEPAGSNNEGGGGGGGAGGLLLLAASTIELEVHGETFANGDYSFSLSADGGIGTQGQFAGQAISAKYPPVPASAFSASSVGGFGGMGIVQLMTPPGNNADGTNTILDDNIRVMQNGAVVSGATKQRYLAWRGWPNAAGTLVDDFGQATAIGGAEGDVRPSPVLLPLF